PRAPGRGLLRVHRGKGGAPPSLSGPVRAPGCRQLRLRGSLPNLVAYYSCCPGRYLLLDIHLDLICSLKQRELKGSHFFVILRELKATEESLNTRCFASLSMT